MRLLKITKQFSKFKIMLIIIILISLIALPHRAQATTKSANVDETLAISKLVTHGYALGVASNFNVFATEQFVQTGGNVSNARIAAGKFTSQLGPNNQKIGWTAPSDKVDPHMLVVGTLNNDTNTRNYTTLGTDKTANIFASGDRSLGSKVLHNNKNNPVDNDPLTSVLDFSETLEEANFDNARSQLAEVSDFYQNKEYLKKTFSDNYLQITDVPASAYKDRGGISATIDDSGASAHGLQVININTASMSGNGGIKTDTGILDINIKIKTSRDTEPIVIINFPNLAGDLTQFSEQDKISITYGKNGDEHGFQNKHNILLNMPKISAINLQNTFVGTYLALNADVNISSLNTSISAIIARNISLGATSMNSEGSTGVFNPDEFGDPDNSAGGGVEDKMMATAKTTSKSVDFSKDASQQLTDLTYSDQVDLNFNWTGYDESQLYWSTDKEQWQKVDPVKNSETNNYQKNLKVSDYIKLNSQTNGSDTVFTTAGTTYYFSLAENTGPVDSNNIKWQSAITLVPAPFSLSIPTTLEFSQIVSENQDFLTVKPKKDAKLTVINDLNTPFSLSVTAEQEAASPSNNVFLDNRSEFTYSKVNLLDSSTVAPVFQQNITPPLLEGSTTSYQMKNFNLQVPMSLRTTKSDIGLTWKLKLGE